MAGTSPRLPEQFRSASEHELDFNVSELISDATGAHSPFGDVELPMPHDQLSFYDYPRPEDRPHLAGEA